MTATVDELSAGAIAGRIRAGELSCEEAVRSHLAVIAERDGAIRAFAALDGELALESARALDALPRDMASTLPLLGVPVAVKDIFDTADLPTEYGSPIYRGHRPSADAALVVLLRAAGAVIVGKAKTTEFAYMHPTDTRNPIDVERTPGGSSSGSAAAVAARMAPLATGTQTAGSIVRPASYCGVLGLKPTFGVLPLAGALPTSASLDTAGLFARSVDDLELALIALTRPEAGRAIARTSRPLGLERERVRAAGPPRLGFARWAWDRLEPAARAAIDAFVEAAAGAGAVLEELELPGSFDELADAQLTIQQVETAAALGGELRRAPELVSEELRAVVAAGRAVEGPVYLAARRLADEQRWRYEAAIAQLDAVLTPSTLGVPPLGLGATGDPLLCRPWTLLGMPSMALPAVWTPEGLPVGIQLAAGAHREARLLDAARWMLERSQPGEAMRPAAAGTHLRRPSGPLRHP